LNTLTWQQVVPFGTVPPRRGSCSSYSPQNGLAYIFGGDAGFALSTTYALYTDPVGIEELASRPITDLRNLRISPNPVVLPCQINAFLQNPGELCVNIIDNSGRLIRTIIESEETAGNHTLIWDGLDQNNRRVPAGTYFIQLNIDGTPITEKVVLVE
ncbi:MAG: FlgD immunoglobulin-like domain containing protein, partial [bacterium]